MTTARWATPTSIPTLDVMWLYIIAFALLIFGIVGSIVSGGIFTIVIVALGVVTLITAVIAGMWAKAQQGRVRALLARSELSSQRATRCLAEPRTDQGRSSSASTCSLILRKVRETCICEMPIWSAISRCLS